MSRPRCAKARRSRACRSPSADGEPRPRAKSRHLARASQPRTGFAGSLGRDERPPRVTCSAGEKGRRWCRATAGLSKSPGDTAPAGGREGCRHDNSRAASPAASRCLAHGRPRPASAPPPRDRRSPEGLGAWRGEAPSSGRAREGSLARGGRAAASAVCGEWPSARPCFVTRRGVACPGGGGVTTAQMRGSFPVGPHARPRRGSRALSSPRIEGFRLDAWRRRPSGSGRAIGATRCAWCHLRARASVYGQGHVRMRM